MVNWNCVRDLEDRIEELMSNVRVLEDELSWTEGQVDKADGALKEAWKLMTREQRIALLDNEYADDYFWGEPESIERRGQ